MSRPIRLSFKTHRGLEIRSPGQMTFALRIAGANANGASPIDGLPSWFGNRGFVSSLNLQRMLVMAVGWLLIVTMPPAAKAQLNSNVGTVTLNATAPESLMVKVTGGANVNFTLAPNTAANAGSTTTTVQTSWALRFGRTQVTVWAWVPNGTAALTDGAGDNIPASAVTAAAAGSGSAGGALNTVTSVRSEERRVGKECRSRWSP